jgi:hypothetical protein
MIVLTFSIVILYPIEYHDSLFSRLIQKSGLSYSAHPYEATFYPQISKIDYAGFVHEQ